MSELPVPISSTQQTEAEKPEVIISGTKELINQINKPGEQIILCVVGFTEEKTDEIISSVQGPKFYPKRRFYMDYLKNVPPLSEIDDPFYTATEIMLLMIDVPSALNECRIIFAYKNDKKPTEVIRIKESIKEFKKSEDLEVYQITE